jgi:hypothetical protein
MAIQVFQEKREPTYSEKLNAGMRKGRELIDQFERESQENQALKQNYGIDLAGIKDPKTREQLISGEYGLRKQNAQNQPDPQELIAHKKARDTIEKQYGPEAAQIFDAAPQGGKTEIIKHFLNLSERGMKYSDMLNQGQPKVESPPEGQESTQARMVDFDKGLNPAERARRQEARYAKNLPLYQQNDTKIQSLEHEADSLAVLEELSPKISGIERLNINPSTGSLIIPALASPEAQTFSKTVNDFTVNAKDSFGARVSNFELDRFMQRLPTLANSEEGRREIIRQMQLVNQMNILRNKAIQDVVEEYGGVRNIDYDQALRLADKRIKTPLESLKKEYRRVDKNLDNQYDKKAKEIKSKTPSGRVTLEKDGKFYHIPKNQLKKVIESNKGYKLVQ